MTNRSRKDRGRSAMTDAEWVGGVRTLTVNVEGSSGSFQPMVALWLELPRDVVVSSEIVDPGSAEGALGRALSAALERPLEGSSRRPSRIRVADHDQAREVRRAVGSGIPVEVAPAPEIDVLVASMAEALSGAGPASYLGNGEVPAKAISELFQAAGRLYQLSPWDEIPDDYPLRLDIPELDVEGACVSLFGCNGDAQGFGIIPSLAGLEALAQDTKSGERGQGTLDADMDSLVLNYVRRADLPDSMEEEIFRHGWTVVDDEAYPLIRHIDADGVALPLEQRDVRIVTACASAVASFYTDHRKQCAACDFSPVEATYRGMAGSVRIAMPYAAFMNHGSTGVSGSAGHRAPRGGRKAVGRNDPCPCGSGRKYKKCCLGLEQDKRRVARQHAATHARDRELVEELMEYGVARFRETYSRFMEYFDDFEDVATFAVPWSVYGFEVEGKTVTGWYLAERGPSLSDDDRAWLEAQQASWLSVWEVTTVEPGQSMTLHDLLTGERRTVREGNASNELTVGSTLLARVVDYGEVSLLGATYPFVLAPFAANEVVRRARGRLRRKRAVPVDRLRDPAFGCYLVRRWEEAVRRLREERARAPVLTNSEGHSFLQTMDLFDLAEGARARVEELLGAMEEADYDEDASVFVFGDPTRAVLAGEGSLVTGTAAIRQGRLEILANSRERADDLRKRIETQCGNLVSFRLRQYSDPMSSQAEPGGVGSVDEIPSAEAQQLMTEWKQQYYEQWIDDRIPALGDVTPRQAAATAEGKDTVAALLKDFEYHERRQYGDAAFDFDPIRRKLGIE